MKKLIILITCCFVCISSIYAQDDNLEVCVNVGGTFPKGNFHKYTDDGYYGNARLVAHLKSMKALSGFTEFSGSFFKYTTEDVLLTDGIRQREVVKKNSQYSVSWHLGMMLGSGSRNSFFRPKLGLAGGLYLFNTQTLLVDDIFIDDPPLAEDNETQVRVGWRGIVGANFFFTPNWGISLEFTSDQVLNLHNTVEFIPEVGVTKVGQSARFNNYSIGVIFPIPID